MDTYKAKVIYTEQNTPTIKTLRFELVDQPAKTFPFLPGQWTDFFIDTINNGRNETLVTGFSMTSSPYNKDYLEFAVKRTNHPITQMLHNMKRGDELKIRGPGGNYFYDSHKFKERNLVLVAGGIGITPFLSMIRHVNEHVRDVNLTLLYSVSNPGELFMYNELQRIANHNQRIKVYTTVTYDEARNVQNSAFEVMKEDAWTGKKGRIDIEMLKEANVLPLNTNNQGTLYFLCGPPAMVQDMKKMLLEFGVQENSIHYEKW